MKIKNLSFESWRVIPNSNLLFPIIPVSKYVCILCSKSKRYSVMQPDGDSSWTALTLYTVMKTAFRTKNMERESFGIFIMKT